ncbi:unnamed protein product [Cyprideis torosa]|uniref:Uncharacterized protein n=1 Tax=Cyprideis torosa TaxID=163714 RepID=A0A7R8W5N0_9CRUS|nr:unnamed protein product [Cyprideis torosa]CAG0885476.1 unnamed protein product [Cyprideis torosa]
MASCCLLTALRSQVLAGACVRPLHVVRRGIISTALEPTDGAWERRLTEPMMKKLNLANYYHDIDKQARQWGRISAVDVDLGWGNPKEGLGGNPKEGLGGSPKEGLGGNHRKGQGGNPSEGLGGNPKEGLGGNHRKGQGGIPNEGLRGNPKEGIFCGDLEVLSSTLTTSTNFALTFQFGDEPQGLWGSSKGQGGIPNEGLGGNPKEGLGGNPKEGLGGNPKEGLGGNPKEGLGGNHRKGQGGNPKEGLGGNPKEGLGGNHRKGLGGNPKEGLGGNHRKGQGGNPKEGLGGNLKEGLGGNPKEERVLGGQRNPKDLGVHLQIGRLVRICQQSVEGGGTGRGPGPSVQAPNVALNH